MARVLFGIDRPTAGEIRLAGEPAAFSDRFGRRRARNSLWCRRTGSGQKPHHGFPDPRQRLATDDRAERTFAGLVRAAESELALVEPHLQRVRLKFHNFDQPVKTLSGGNQL